MHTPRARSWADEAGLWVVARREQEDEEAKLRQVGPQALAVRARLHAGVRALPMRPALPAARRGAARSQRTPTLTPGLITAAAAWRAWQRHARRAGPGRAARRAARTAAAGQPFRGAPARTVCHLGCSRQGGWKQWGCQARTRVCYARLTQRRRVCVRAPLGADVAAHACVCPPPRAARRCVRRRRAVQRASAEGRPCRADAARGKVRLLVPGAGHAALLQARGGCAGAVPARALCICGAGALLLAA